MDYSIIKLGNKQHRVRDGETLVVDRVATDEGKTFEPVVLLGDKVTATVVAHGRGPKILIGKYKRRTGYKRHNGFRAAVSEIEITIGSGTARKAAAKAKPAKPETPKVEAEVVDAAPVEEVAAPVTEAAAPAADVEGLPEGYDSMTVSEIKAAADGWGAEELEAALAYEEAHGARKGAISALEAAIAKDEEGEENGA
jgi:large subunit ribosomal protein L21